MEARESDFSMMNPSKFTQGASLFSFSSEMNHDVRKSG